MLWTVHPTRPFFREAGCAGALLACMTASSDVELMRWAAKALESLCANDQGVFSEAAAEVGRSGESLGSWVNNGIPPTSGTITCQENREKCKTEKDIGFSWFERYDFRFSSGHFGVFHICRRNHIHGDKSIWEQKMYRHECDIWQEVWDWQWFHVI